MINTGQYGELCAAQYFRKKKWEIRAANFRSRFGEIDLIVSDGHCLVFVEVKTRDASAIAAPMEFVDLHKQRRLVKTAQYYLCRCPTGLQPRFDVIEVLTRQGEMVRLNHIENAFDTEEIG